MLVGMIGVATAQKTYAGVTLSLPIAFGVGVLPLPGFQVGSEVADNLEVRGTLDTLILASLISADVLYTAPIPDTTSRWYAGGGAGIALVTVADVGGVAFFLRAPVGIEYFTTPETTIGLFGEMQPGFGIAGGEAGSLFIINLRAGVNFHF